MSHEAYVIFVTDEPPMTDAERNALAQMIDERLLAEWRYVRLGIGLPIGTAQHLEIVGGWRGESV